MKLSFSYNADKDVENFILGAKRKNVSRPTNLESFYEEKFGKNLEVEKIKELIEGYIKENEVNVELRLNEIKANWLSIENDFINRIEKLFEVKFPSENIAVYLTTNGRCTYNIQENYFFIGFNVDYANATIMHELFHFYTHYVFYDELKKRSVSDSGYNEIKESLTELLNSEFFDLMNGREDKGYSNHQDMRKKIKEIWPQNKNLKSLIQVLVDRLI